MLKWLGNLKLRNQLALMVAISIFMLILVQLVYYFRFYTVTQQKNDVYVSNLLDQVEERLKTNYNDIKNAAFTISSSLYVQQYLMEKNYEKKLELNNYILDMIQYIAKSNESIVEVMLIDSEDKMTILNLLSQDNSFWIFNELKKKVDINDKNFIMPAFLSLTKDYYALCAPIFSLNNTIDANEKIGYCFILCKSDYFQEVVGKISMSKNSLFIVHDGANRIVASNNESLQGSIFKAQGLHFGNDSGGSKFTGLYNKQRSIIHYNYNQDSKWSAISIVPLNEMTWDIRWMRSFGVVIGAAMAFLLFIISFALSRNITRPIAKIVTFLGRISEANLDKRLDLIKHNEMGDLAKHINKMLDEIEGMTKRIVTHQASLFKLEISKKQAELSALQNQINPHFLYNTLECIRSIALDSDVMEIVKISSAMAKIFRYSIKGDEFVSVGEEKNCIMDYLDIMSIRFRGRFDVDLEIEASLLDIKILKMILQPIVENAVYHGLEQKAGRGRLAIKGMFGDRNNVVFEISDNGKGISEEELSRLNDTLSGNSNDPVGKRSVGLKNIDNRIKLTYGAQFGIKIESEENVGTKVVVDVPL